MSEISAAQIRLSEELQLLHELNYSDFDMSYQSAGVRSTKGDRDRETNADIRMLDLIAVCLTTGDSGDVVAATFDKREQISLVLAKNGRVTAADHNATREFFSDLMAATEWIDLLPFLVDHGKTNMGKRIRSLHQALSTFDFESATKGYSNTSIEVEFPHLDSYRTTTYQDGDLPFSRVLGELIHKCIDASNFEVNEDKESFVKYILLVNAARVLHNSRFLKGHTHDRGLLNSERKEDVEKLNRCLGKVCQYGKLKKLIDMVKRWFPGGNIPFRWVDESFVGTGEGKFELCVDPLEAAGRAQGKRLSPEIIGEISKQFPYLIRNWETRRSINPCIHAELRIILHLSQPLLSIPRPERTQLPIGCSKRSCLCCVLWIDIFNTLYTMSWMTSRSHGKPYDNWALPGDLCKRIMGGDVWHIVDKTVINGVNVRLVDTLVWISKGSKRISDERASSGSDSDASDNAKEAFDDIELGDYKRVPNPKS